MSERLQEIQGKVSGAPYFRVTHSTEEKPKHFPKLLSHSRNHAFHIKEVPLFARSSEPNTYLSAIPQHTLNEQLATSEFDEWYTPLPHREPQR